MNRQRNIMSKWLILIIVGLLFVIFFRNRWIFDYKFEPIYWDNFYYHSQWNIPNSTRVIGDEGLYQYAGWRYANGDNPFDINYMVPPLGKWLYGLGINFFDNPYLISVLVYFVSLIFYILILKRLFNKKSKFWIGILILVMNPMLIAQIRATMLDSIQMMFLLGQIYFLFTIDKNNKKWTIPLAGIFLGLMSGVKIALFLPIIGLIDLWYLAKKQGIKSWVFFSMGIIIGYLLAYFCYFSQHPNPIPWLKLHEKVWDFWKSGNGLGADPMGVLRFLFFNRFLGWWEGAKMVITREWTPIIPLGLGLAIYYLIKLRKTTEKNLELIYLSLLTVGWFVVCMMIAFWTRYLIPVIPILCLITVFYLKKSRWFEIGIIVISFLFMIPALESDPEEAGRFMCRYISTDAYQESYRLLTPEIRKMTDEESWINLNRKIKLITGSEKSECQMNIEPWRIGQRKVLGKAKITFTTREGFKTYYQTVEFEDVKGEWKVNWQWDMNIINDFKTSEQKGDGLEWRYIWVIPEQIENWGMTAEIIGNATELNSSEVWKALQKVVPDKYPVTVGWVKETVKTEEYQNLIKDKAIRIEKRNNPNIKSRWKILEKTEEIRLLEI